MCAGDERPSVQVDLLDHKLLRRELETETLQAVQDFGFTVSYVEDNMQLLISSVILMCGAAAHLLPGDFRAQQDGLKICVIMYYVLVAINFACWAVTNEGFLVLCASESHRTPRMRVSLKLKRFAADFTLKMTSKDRSITSPSMLVESFFHEDGYISRPKYHKWVRQQLQAFSKASA